MNYNSDGSVSSVFVVNVVNGVLTLVPLTAWGASIDSLPSYADEAIGTSTLAVLGGNVLVYLAAYFVTK